MNAPLLPAQLSPALPPQDSDPEESAEWQLALQSVLERAGPERVRQIMDMLAATARTPTIGWQPPTGTAYVNTIAVEQQAAFPGDLAIEERLAIVRKRLNRPLTFSEKVRPGPALCPV